MLMMNIVAARHKRYLPALPAGIKYAQIARLEQTIITMGANVYAIIA